MHKYIKQIFFAQQIYTGQLLTGYSYAWMLYAVNYAVATQDLTHSQYELLATGDFMYIGYCIGPFLTYFILNQVGRKPCFFLGGLLYVVTFLTMALGKDNIAAIFAALIINFFGGSIIAVTSLVYLGEIPSTNIRGLLLCGLGVVTVLGNLIAQEITPSVSLAWHSYIALILTAIYLIGLVFLPESPVFYSLKYQNEKALDSLAVLGRNEEADTVVANRDDSTNVDDQNIFSKPNNDQKQGHSSAQNVFGTTEDKPADWRDLYRVKSNRKALIITLALYIMVHLSGYTVVRTYINRIYSYAELYETIDWSTVLLIILLLKLASGVLALVFIEILGRKILLLISSALCCLSLVLLAVGIIQSGIFNPSTITSPDTNNALSIAAAIIFFLSYGFGFNVIPGTLVGELFQPAARGLGATITYTVSWALYPLILQVYSNFIIDEGTLLLWISAVVCAGAFVVTLIFVPETKKRTFSEIDALLGKTVSI